MPPSAPSTSLEAKLVVLGSQGVGKTSLVHRYVKNAFIQPEKAQSTIGANFVTTTLNEPESGTTIRLQIWDTAGQERFRSISRLYYRGSNAAILAYDVTSRKSFDDMGLWLKELRDNCGGDLIIHVVGTKTDMLASEPQKREVPFERCIGYVAEQLYPEIATAGQRVTFQGNLGSSHGSTVPPLASPTSNRSSGFWGQDTVFDCCHEVSAKEGEGIDEVFRIITRKLVEQHHKKLEHLKMLENMQSRGCTPGAGAGADSQGYFDMPKAGTGSFRVGAGDKRRSWLNFPLTPGALTSLGDDHVDEEVTIGMRKGKCCREWKIPYQAYDSTILIENVDPTMTKGPADTAHYFPGCYISPIPTSILSTVRCWSGRLAHSEANAQSNARLTASAGGISHVTSGQSHRCRRTPADQRGRK